MTDTVQALTHFDTKWAANNALKPTIAFAYEQASRSVGLDAVRTGTGYLSQSGASLTVDMQGSSQPAPLDTMVGLKWTHYCRAASASSWWPAGRLRISAITSRIAPRNMVAPDCVVTNIGSVPRSSPTALMGRSWNSSVPMERVP